MGFQLSRRYTTIALGIGSSLLMTGCSANPFARWFSPITSPPTPESPSEDLSFIDISLEQVNPQGEKIWELEALKVTYQDETQLAVLDKPSGVLFQEGEATYRVSGDSGTVNEAVSELTLEGNVVLELLTEDGQVEGQKLTWQPNEAFFLLEGNLQGHYQAVNFSGQRAELRNREQQLLLSDTVVADLTTNKIRLRTEALTWDIAEKVVEGIVPVVLEHYATENPEQVIDRATGDGIRADLTKQHFSLSPNALVTLGKSQLEIRSKTLLWDTIAAVIRSDTPITITTADRSQIRGNTGEFALNTQIATLVGAIEAQHQNPLGKLWADRVQWQLENDRIEAVGAVRYEQPSSGLKMEGTQAIGNLGSQEIEVTGSQQVKTVYVLP